MDDYGYTNDIVLTPNPAKQYVRVSSNEHSIIGISIYNNVGKLIFHENISDLEKYQINTSKFPSGVYMLNFQTKDSIKLYKKLIVE